MTRHHRSSVFARQSYLDSLPQMTAIQYYLYIDWLSELIVSQMALYRRAPQSNRGILSSVDAIKVQIADIHDKIDSLLQRDSLGVYAGEIKS
jgi:hypothetical protein